VQFVAKTLAGLESVLEKEIIDLGGTNVVPLKRAVQFEGNLELLYRANYELRTAVRILKPVASFSVKNEHELYRQVQTINWEDFMSIRDTLAIDAAVTSPHFNHSKYVALKTKDAIVDQFRNKTGRRPSVDINNPFLRINVHIGGSLCTIALDSSGDSLHKRNYRIAQTAAPLSEVLAAGMLKLAGWKADRDFVDPMCGSGTILIEAAMMAYNIPAQIMRKDFGFMNWPDFDARLWRQVKQEARKKQRAFRYNILGSDMDLEAIKATRTNCKTLRLDNKVKLQQKDFAVLELEENNGGLMIINPPYGERLEEENINALYTMMGDRMKHVFTGFDAWVISSNFDAFKHLGLRTSKKIPLFNGSLECKFQHYELYKGSRKKKFR
jgi:putative N6-adenine-specific DNA methylase